MEKREKLEKDISVDLYPADDTNTKKKTWNMLDPHKMVIVSTYDHKWVIIEFEGKQYITDRAILKGIL